MSSYDQAVTEARSLVKRSEADQWRLAQLTYENASPSEGDGKMTLAAWARDIGVHPSYASRLYHIWETYGLSRDLDQVEIPTFAEANRMISPTSGWQPRQPEVTYSPPGPFEPVDPVERTIAALADPAVAAAVLADPDTARAIVEANPYEVAKAQQQMHKRERDKAVPPGSREERVREREETRYEVLVVLQDLIRLRTDTAKLAGLGAILPDETIMLAEEAKLTTATVAWLADLAPDGVQLGDEVTAWLREQASS
jgi:hypothetical protein